MTKKIPLLIVLLFLIFSYAQGEDHFRARVIKVLDGDSIVLSNEEEVRYIGIDTPEYGQPYAEEAKEFNRRLVDGKTVGLEFDIEDRDRYGRLLAYVYVGGLFVNAELVKEGYASVYTTPPNVKYTGLFLELQNRARKDNKGLWAKIDKGAEPYYLASKKSTKFHRPWCRWAKKISPRNLVRYKSRAEALDKGLSPCKVCDP